LTTLINATFEDDEVNPSPRVELGATPAGWEVGDEGNNTSGLRDLCVVAEGSPFNGGSRKCLLVLDTSRADSRLDWRRKFPPQKGAITVAFDVRVNDGIGHSNSGYFVPQILAVESGQETPVAFLKFQCSGEVKDLSLQANDGTLLPMLRPGVWCRIEFMLPAVNSGQGGSVRIAEHSASPTEHKVALTKPSREGYSILHLSTGFGPDGVGDFNLDNISVTTTKAK
jgi:hypothetical protein